MNTILSFFNEYASLFNFALFATIIGILINLTKISKESLEEKHSAELAVLRSTIAGLETENKSLQNRLTSAAEQSEARVVLLQQQLVFFQKLSDLPDDKRAEWIKVQYDTRIAELEKQASELKAEAVEEKEILQAEILELRKESKEFVKIDRKIIDSFVELAPKIFRLTTEIASKMATMY